MLLHVFKHDKLIVTSFVCLFDLILYVPVKKNQLCHDRSFWVEPLSSTLKQGLMCLAQGHGEAQSRNPRSRSTGSLGAWGYTMPIFDFQYCKKIFLFVINMDSLCE